MNARCIAFIIITSLSCAPMLFSETPDADFVPALIRSKFGVSEWTRALDNELAPLIHEYRVSADALRLVLRTCDRTMESLDAHDAAAAIFTFAYECDMCLKRGMYPVKLKSELRSMMKRGAENAGEFTERLKLRSRETYRMIEQIKNGSSTKKLYRYLGGETGKNLHGRPGDGS